MLKIFKKVTSLFSKPAVEATKATLALTSTSPYSSSSSSSSSTSPYCRRVVDGKPHFQSILNDNPGYAVYDGELGDKAKEGKEVQEDVSSAPIRGFIDQEEEEELLKEADSLQKSFAFEACDPVVLSSSRKIVAKRVTGRPEVSTQRIAPWGYGDNFKRAVLQQSFPGILKIAERIEKEILNSSISTSTSTNTNTNTKDQDQPNTNTNTNANTRPPELRDITINYRENGMFMLDPHLDPPEDGGQVFILGMMTDVVLTLTPDIDILKKELKTAFQNNPNPNSNSNSTTNHTTNSKPMAPSFPYLPTPLRITNKPEAIALVSWTDADLDILLRRRCLVHLTDNARYKWKHAIRIGVEADASALPITPATDPAHKNNGLRKDDSNSSNSRSSNSNNTNTNTVVCDWWGSINTLIPRGNKRISIIFAFK